MKQHNAHFLLFFMLFLFVSVCNNSKDEKTKKINTITNQQMEVVVTTYDNALIQSVACVEIKEFDKAIDIVTPAFEKEKKEKIINEVVLVKFTNFNS